MSRQMLICGLLVIIAFIAAFASLTLLPGDPTPTVTVSELQSLADFEQLLQMQVI